MYDLKRFGPALKALREARGLRQAEVARRAGVSDSIPSRAEQGEAKINLASLIRYLNAIDASLTDLDNQLAEAERDHLDVEIDRDERLLEKDPTYREAYRQFFRELGLDPSTHGPERMASILEKFDDHDRRIGNLESRVGKIEKDPKR